MKIKSNKKGFTLIELLIVISIIGILAAAILVSQYASRNKANAADTKTTLSSLKYALGQCCSNLSNSMVTDNVTGNGGLAICNTASTTVTYPTPIDLKLDTGGTVKYTPIANCGGSNPSVKVTITGHPDAKCLGDWTLEAFGKITPPSGC